MKTLSKNVKITKVKDVSAAGQTAVNSDAVDMQGYAGVLFVLTAQAITAGGAQSINAAQSDTSGGTYADLSGSGITIADDADNTAFYLDVRNPGKRYVRLEIARATQNSAFGEIYAIQYGAQKAPVSNSNGELHVWPTEGTA